MIASKEVSCVRKVYQCNVCTEKYINKQSKCPNCLNKKGLISVKFTIREMYCLDKILSYGVFINLIIGGRRGGKTFACAEYCVNKWIEKQEKFVWIRRYKTEKDKALEAFTKLGYSFDKKGVYYEETLKDIDTKKTTKIRHYIGLFLSVSTASRIRGGEFGDFTTLVWDEYGDEAGTEFKKEFMLFNSIVTSVFDEKEGCVALVLSNNVNRFLPIYQHAEVQWDQEWTINYKKDVVAHVWKRDFEFIGSASKWLQTTDYYDYAVHNKPLDYDKQLIETYKLEYAPPEYCFRMGGAIKQNLRLIKTNDGFAVDYCVKCKHNWIAIDTINSIKYVKVVSSSKQIELLQLYMKQLIVYTTPQIKQEFTTWVARHLHLI